MKLLATLVLATLALNVHMAAGQAVCSPACSCVCPPTGLDDQDCYQTPRRNTFRPAIPLTIQDQFGTIQANAVNFHRLCAPANKNGDCPMCSLQPDHYLGLTLAQVTGATSSPHVSLSYQFGVIAGDIGSVVGGPGFLLTPASKSLVPPAPAPPAGLHNYNCYRLVNTTGNVTGDATVTDQFVMNFPMTLRKDGPWTVCVGADVDGTDPGAVGVTPVFLCNLVNDTHLPFNQETVFADSVITGQVIATITRYDDLCMPATIQ